MTRKPSMVDVAQLAGVSRTTVSYVLNNVTAMHISEKTRQRVLQAARELDYHPNAIARSLARQQIFTLGLVLCLSRASWSSNTFLPSILYGINSILAPAGFRLLVEPIEDLSHSDAYISLVREAHINGMILAGVRSDNPQLHRLYADNFPIVLWGKVEGSELPFVDVDNVNGARMAVEHLIGLGHRRIACITNAAPLFSESVDRLHGYQMALEAHNLPFDESLIRYGDFREDSGFEAMHSILMLPERPSAVFVASDVVALGALRAARSVGLHVPQDLALVGFDDIQFSKYVVPPLTTIRVPAYNIGSTSARMVLEIIETGQQPAPVLLDTELVIRESCGAQM